MRITRPRSPLEITWAVWRALFLREAVSRLSAGRAAWLWLLFEPVVHVVFFMVIFGVIRQHTVGGVDGAMFIMTGVLGFFAFRNASARATNAVGANAALFAYRQVLPVDAVLVRAALEFVLLFFVAVIVLGGASVAGYEALPQDPLRVVQAGAGLWLVGVGAGLVFSVGVELVPEIGRFLDFFFNRSLYFASGIFFPPLGIPQPYRDWLMLNPLLHGVEAVRIGFFHQYQTTPDVDLGYLYGFALVTIFLGLALHARFALRLVTK